MEAICRLISQNFGVYMSLVIYAMIVFFLIWMTVSIWRHRQQINISQLLMRDNKISKVGVSWVFCILVFIYQIMTSGTISSELITLLLVILGAELGSDTINAYQKVNIRVKETDKPISKSAKHCTSVDDINDL